MSDLPPGWAHAPLSALGTEIRGSIAPAPGIAYELYSVPTFPTGLPELLDGAEIGSAKRPVQPGDVLLCKINPRINRVWIVGEQQDSRRPQLASPEYLVLRTRNADLGRYLLWYLRSPGFREWIKLSVEGATGSHTRAKSRPILNQLISVPSLNEQRRIVAAIEEHLSRLDAADVSTGAAERRLGALSRQTLAGAINGWPERELGDFSRVFVGTTPSRRRPELWNGNVPWVSSGEVAFCRISTTRETISPEAVRSSDRVHPAGTVLLGMIGEGKTRGQAAILDVAAAHNQNSAAIRLEPAVCLPEWLFYVFMARYEETRRVGSGGQQPALNGAKVGSLRIPVPPLDEQRRIVAEVEERLGAIDALRAAIERAQRKGAALRRSVLERAFRGELVSQDPSDEPASVLLDRINAEREASST